MDLTDERRELLDTLVEHIQIYALFLFTLNDVEDEEEALYVRDTLFEAMTPEDDQVVEIEFTGRSNGDKN